MADRQLLARLGVAVVVVGALAGGVVLLTGGDDPPPQAVAVVGEPPPAVPASSRPPDQTVTRTPSAETPQPANDWRITYELTGSGTATLVYDENGLGLVHQELAVPLPWRKELTWQNTGVPPRVQLQGQGDGRLECRITVRGSLVTSDKAAKGDVVTCAGKLTP
ncbi:MmpS family transport accessory protein [Amycolatopsis sp. H20-H5]|uniref:MmpS family transport accessory protein n=1 Tax=Amycolatopsis sp. H20-H5 TaxID=3046309 RepID=UPI002DBA3CA1|nr:MmpS family transport accessory protein [Amycolatopsis sp. H20-H5]MEC3979166.1 MmpS family transport accessory protein [Amycolatopsis sp. H20-H5]